MERKPQIRGLADVDGEIFAPQEVERLRLAQTELQFLLGRGYPMQSAITVIGNHHQLTARQLLALTRSTSSSHQLSARERKRLEPAALEGQILNIDGFNLIITLEVALSGGTLFMGQDGCIRDLAQLRGTYSILPQTETAISLIRQAAGELNIAGISFLLDAPIPHSGKLKAKMYENPWGIPVTVDIVRNPDAALKKLACVVSSDAIILDECASWFNLAHYIVMKMDKPELLRRLVCLDGKE